jgi:hypothetical protein
MKLGHIEYELRSPGDIIDYFESKPGAAEQYLAMLRDGLYVPENYRTALRVYFKSCLLHTEEAAE